MRCNYDFEACGCYLKFLGQLSPEITEGALGLHVFKRNLKVCKEVSRVEKGGIAAKLMKWQQERKIKPHVLHGRCCGAKLDMCSVMLQHW